METFQKILETEDGDSFIDCPKAEATHILTTYPNETYEMGQEKPGRRDLI